MQIIENCSRICFQREMVRLNSHHIHRNAINSGIECSLMDHCAAAMLCHLNAPSYARTPSQIWNCDFTYIFSNDCFVFIFTVFTERRLKNSFNCFLFFFHFVGQRILIIQTELKYKVEQKT